MKRKNLFLFLTAGIALAVITLWACKPGVEADGIGGGGGDGGGTGGTPWTPPPDTTSAPAIVTDNPDTGTRVYFLAPTGSDATGDGSIENPWFSLTKAQEAVKAGDTVYLRAGTYVVGDNYGTQALTAAASSAYTRIIFNKSGTDGNPITYAGYPGDLPARPLLDFSTFHPKTGNTERRTCGMALGNNSATISASWLWLRGFDITGITDYTLAANAGGSVIQVNNGSHNTLENLRIYNCAGTGVSSDFNRVISYTLVKNCDFFNLHSVTNPSMNQNTDGAGYHLKQPGSINNVFYGCRAWAVGDDGFDSIRAEFRVVYDHCWMGYTAFNYDDDTTTYQDWITKLDISLLDYNGGNGNGLKLGGYSMGAVNSSNTAWRGVNPGHVLRYCLTLGNHRAGVTHNYAPGSGTGTDGQSYFNTTAYNNRINFEMIARAPETMSSSNARRRNAYGVTLKRNISYKNLQPGHELYEVIDYVPDAEPQEYPVRWLDFESGVIENNTFGIADNGGKGTHALDGVFNVSGGDTTDFDSRSGAYLNGVDAVKDIIQYLFPITDSDFLSLDENKFLTPRLKNGDLPEIEFLRPVADSPLADIGYTAPDTDEDGYRDFWKYAGSKPVLPWAGFAAAFPENNWP
jgi:hypothetical protein